MQITKVQEDRRQFLAHRQELKRLAMRLFPERTEADLEKEIWTGSLKPFDAHYLAVVLRRHKPASILEVGSYLGMSTRWILHVSEPWKASVTCVDPNIPHWSFKDPLMVRREFLQPFSHRSVENVVGFFSKVGEGMNDDVPSDQIASIPSVGPSLTGRYDMVFLDGDHTYDVVKEDFAVALKLLNPGGTVVFHDAISWSGVSRLLTELKPRYKISVLGRALDTVGKRLANKGMDGIAVLQT
jgi:predicted O-methyltransferase YrrM